MGCRGSMASDLIMGELRKIREERTVADDDDHMIVTLPDGDDRRDGLAIPSERKP